MNSRITAQIDRLLWLASAVAVMTVLLACRARYFVMPTMGMEPTIKKGERFSMAPLDAAGRASVLRGEVVVFRLPGRSSDLQVKRVIAVGGDWVEIRAKHLLVNGREPMEPYVTHTEPTVLEGDGTAWNLARDRVPARQVPKGRLFLLGDNRDNSLDSRFFGDVPVEDIVGRVNETR